ncbi:Tiparp [Symbiodinium sp. CCMP2592]|nr:Tiparp [Symbiodinium sp. CCMP2592]
MPQVYTRDRRGAPIPDRFVVKDVHRVLNDQATSEYCDTREKIRSKLNGEKPSLPDGSHTVNVLQKGGLGALPPLDSEVNEHWLFHGTTAEAATGIAENDFRSDLSQVCSSPYLGAHGTWSASARTCRNYLKVHG